MKLHRLTPALRRALAVTLSAAMALGLTACQQAQDTAGSTATAPAVETSESQSAAQAQEGEAGDEGGTASVYLPTEENENEQVVMNDQPESSYWFPEQLLEWDPSQDPDLAYNVSTVPLAKRADIESLQTVNSTQNKGTKVMAISIMNASTSGNAPQGLNKFSANTFGYLQYVDLLVYWGGSSGEGLIVAPSPDVVDMGHRNGVKVIRDLLFPAGGPWRQAGMAGHVPYEG